MVSLKEDHAIVVITHSLMEAARVADRVAYFHMGRLLEIGATDAILTAPSTAEAKRFIDGLTG